MELGAKPGSAGPLWKATAFLGSHCPRGQVAQDLVGGGEDLGFYREGGGSPGGLWAEEGRGLTQALTGALWWPLLGGHAVGGEFGSQGAKGGGNCAGPGE